MASRPAAYAALALAALLAGCTAFGGGRSTAGHSTASAGQTPASLERSDGSDTLALYFNTLRDLLEGDAVVKADVFRNVAAAADAAPTTSNRLNLALALATPGHPASDPTQAQRLLNELLANADALLPGERVLALMQLKDVEQRLILDAEAARLQRAAQAAAAQRNDQGAQRLQAALDENRQLRQQLDEARAKLDAITNIERSIRERESGTNPK
jgi:cell division septum initiation protein DivIVA